MPGTRTPAAYGAAGKCGIRQRIQILPFQQYLAAGGGVHPAKCLQQGRFAAAAGPDDGGKPALLDLHIHPAQGVGGTGAGAVGTGHSPGFQLSLIHI